MKRLRRVMVGACACTTVFMLAPVGAYSQEEEYLSKTGKAIAAEKKEAPEDYQRAIDAVKEGNEAKKKGDDAAAYCLYGEAIYRLEHLSRKYPNWEKELVQKQIKNITDVTDKLTAVTCQNLEQMKESQFRLAVWKRQVLMLDKLNKIMERLDYLERQYWERDDKYIKDIRDVMFKRLDK